MTEFQPHVCTECRKTFGVLPQIDPDHCPHCGEYPGDHRLS